MCLCESECVKFFVVAVVVVISSLSCGITFFELYVVIEVILNGSVIQHCEELSSYCIHTHA